MAVCKQGLLDLVDGEAVGAGRAHVQRELLVVAAGHQRGQRDQRAAAAVESGAGPDGAPRVLGDQLLEVAGEVGGVLRSRGRRARRRAPRGAPPCRRRTWSCRTSFASATDDHRDLARAPRRAPGVRRRRGRRADPAARRPRSRAAGRVGRPGRAPRPPRPPARRSRRAGRGRRTPRARRRPRRTRRRRRPGACAAAPTRAPARARGSRARTSAARTRSPARRCRRRGPGRSRSRHTVSSPIFAPVQQSTAPRTRSGASSSSCSPTSPPTESPA